MPEIIASLRASSVTRHMSVDDIQHIAGLFTLFTYPSGQSLTGLKDTVKDGLSIVAHGNIQVKLNCGIGESTVCTLAPGDLIEAHASSTHDAHFYAYGDTQILSLSELRFDYLVDTHPELMCQLIRGMTHNMQDILFRTNQQIAQLKNYLYSTHARN